MSEVGQEDLLAARQRFDRAKEAAHEVLVSEVFERALVLRRERSVEVLKALEQRLLDERSRLRTVVTSVLVLSGLLILIGFGAGMGYESIPVFLSLLFVPMLAMFVIGPKDAQRVAVDKELEVVRMALLLDRRASEIVAALGNP